MRDQTDRDWLKGWKQNDLGTALYLVPEDIGKSLRGSLVQDVTYGEARAIGGMRLAHEMKWIPHSHAGFTDILSRGGACGQPCTDSCVELGCLCNQATKRCESAL
jgi:hypothetical protein